LTVEPVVITKSGSRYYVTRGYKTYGTYRSLENAARRMRQVERSSRPKKDRK
jgi:hypothetical protein